MEKEKRPWGDYQVILEEDYCKVKKIHVRPNQSLSYQYHFKRSETWVIAAGSGIVTLEGKDISVEPGDVINILPKQKHRVRTESNDLVFIEIQRGTYFGEDDIVRIEDVYGRC